MSEWEGLSNGTGMPAFEATIEELAETARWLRWIKAWGEIGFNAAIGLLAKRHRRSA